MKFCIIPPEQLTRVLTELVATASSGQSQLPEALGAELRHLIASALVGPVALNEYLEALTNVLGGRSFPPILVDSLPLCEVIRQGLQPLSDEQVIGLALTAEAFRYVNETISAALLVGTAGQCWEDAELIPDDRIPPDHLPESVLRKSREHYGRLQATFVAAPEAREQI